MEYGNLGFSSADGKRSWRADHRPGQALPTAHWRQEDPGVIPSGDIYGPGSPTGIEYYENGALGSEYENMLFSAEAGRNSIWAYSAIPDGAGFKLKRSTLFSTSNPDLPPEALNPQDARKWFRPSDVLVGVDGAIYVSDFFDSFVGGHRMRETEGKGTIYRITRKGTNPQPSRIDFGSASGQLDALKNRAHSIRFAAYESLTGKPTDEGVDGLIAMSRHQNSRFAARALYALAEIGVAGRASAALVRKARSRVDEMLVHVDPNLRIVAYRALRRHDPEGLVRRANRMASDPSPAVRREVALSLRDVSFDQSKNAIATLYDHFEPNDRWYLEALGTASEGNEAAVWKMLRYKADADPARWNRDFADLSWRLHPESAVTALEQRAISTSLTQDQRRQALDALGFIATRGAGEAVLAAATSGPEDLRSYAAWWVTARSGNEWQGFGLESRLPVDPEAEAAAAEAKRMAQGRNKLRGATELSDEVRQIAIAMAQSPVGGPYVMHLAGRNELPKFLYPVVSDHIHSNPDASVRALASRYFPRESATGERLPPINEIANLVGDSEKGRELYFGRAVCATCHTHGSEGRDIGPDLTEVGQRFDRIAILDFIINPSAAIAFGYESVVIETVEGHTLSGFVVGDGNTVILKDLGGQQHRLPQESIRSRQKLSQSIMPAGGSMALSAQDLADLVSFLVD